MIPVQRLNHAVLYVRDASASARWYSEVFGFQILTEIPGVGAFLRAGDTDNHHDLGLFSVGADAPSPQPGRVGLYHLAWQVGSVTDLVAAREELIARGAFVGESDHGASKSLYAKDPDGNEFEIMWAVPRADWPSDDEAIIAPLDLDGDVARYA